MGIYHINDGAGVGSHTLANTNDGSSVFASIPPAIGAGGITYPGILDNAWTPDGRILYTDNTRHNIWLYDPCKQTVTQIAGSQTGAARPSMGIPGDGTGPHVFWEASGCYVMSKDISNLNNLAQTFAGTVTNPATHPHVSDDALFVAHAAPDANGHSQVYMTKRDKSLGPAAITAASGLLTENDHPHIGKDPVTGYPVVAFRQFDKTGLVETDPTTYKANQIKTTWVNPATLGTGSHVQLLVNVAAGQQKMVTNPSIHPDFTHVVHDHVDSGAVSGTPFGGAKDVTIADSNQVVTVVATLTTDATKVAAHLASKGVRRVK